MDLSKAPVKMSGSGTPDTKATNVPLEEMTREDLIAKVKRQLVFLQKAKAKCDGLNDQISSLQSHEKENESLNNKCLELEKYSNESGKVLDKLRDDYVKLQKDKLALEEQMQCLMMKNATLSEMCQSFQVELSVSNKSNQEDKDQMILLNEARDAALNSMRELKNILKEKEFRITSLEEDLRSSQESGAKLLDKFETLIYEMDSLTSQNVSLQDDYDGVKRQLKISLDELDNWKAKVEELENEKDDYVGPTVDVSELQYKIEELEQELDLVSQEKMQLSEENLNLTSRLEGIEQNYARIKEEEHKTDEYDSRSLRQIAIYLDQIRSLEEDLLKTMNQKDDLSEELEQVHDETKELHEECQFLKQEVKSLEEQSREYSERIVSLDKKLSESEEKAREFYRDSELMDVQLEEISTEYKDKIKVCENELEDKRTLLMGLELENNALNETMVELRDEIKTLTLSTLNKTDEMKIEEYEMEISRLNELLVTERDKIDSLLKSRETRDGSMDLNYSGAIPEENVQVKNYKEFKMDEFEATTSSDQDKEDNVEPNSEIKDLTNALNEKTALVESIHLQMDDLINQIDELNSIIAEKESDIDSLGDKLQEQRQDINEKDDRIKLLLQSITQDSQNNECKSAEPQKEFEEPQKEPQKEFEEPQKEFEVPQKEFEEPQKEFEEPQKEFEEPQKEFEEPQKEFEEPQKEFEEPQKEFEEPQKEFEEPQKEFEEPQKEFEEPQKEFEEPQKEFEEPQKEFEEPQKEFEEPQKEFEEPQKEFEEPQKEFEEPQKEFEEPQKEFEEPQKEFEEPQKEFEEPQKEFEEPQKEFEEHQKEFEEHQKEFEEHQKEFEEPLKECMESEKKMDESSSELKEHEESKGGLKELEGMKNELKQGKIELSESTKDLIELEGLKTKLKESKDELEESRRELEDSKKELEELRTKLEESKKELVELREKFEEVHEDRENLFDHSRTVEDNESCLIQKLELEESLREFCAELEFRLDEVILERDSQETIYQSCPSCQELRREVTSLSEKLEEKSRATLEVKNKLEIASQSLDAVSKEKQQRLMEMESNLSETRNEIDSLSKERAEIFDDLERQKTALNNALDSNLNNEYLVTDLKRENEKLRIDFSNLQSKLEQFDNVERSALDSLRKIEELTNVLTDSRKEMNDLKEENEELRSKIELLSLALTEAQKENATLLDLTKENEKQQRSLDYKINFLERESSESGQKLEESSETLSLVQNENVELKERLRESKMNEEIKQKCASVEEDATNKELTDNKEKMEKLKKVIFKLKKELAETQKSLSEAKSIKEELSNLSRGHLQNFQSLQAEYDKLQDDYEASKVDNKRLDQDIRSKVKEVISLKEESEREKSEIHQLRASLEMEKLEKKKFEELKAERESQVIVLRSEKEAETKKWLGSRNEIKKLENHISSVEGKLKAEKEAHNQTVQKLEESTKAAKKHEVLNLEINDFETTIYNMEEKIAEKDRQIGDLRKEIETLDEKELFLKDEIERLNSQRLTEEYRLENLKDVLEKTKSQLSEKELSEKEHLVKLEDSRSELEKAKSNQEEWQMRLSETSNAVTSLERALKSFKENYSKSSKTYEARVSHLEKELSSSLGQVENARKEFESYKARVHSVLKQKQTPASTLPSQLEEKERLEKTLENYREKLETLNDEMNVKNVELETFQRENSLLISKIDKLTREMKRKDDDWTEKYLALVKDQESSRASWENERNRIVTQKEVLNTNFKIQIESLKEEHQLSADSLQRQLDGYERELITLKQKEQQQKMIIQNSPHDETSFDVSSLERQEGEGSECAESLDLNSLAFKPLSLNTIPSSGFTPLEQLLRSNSENLPSTSPLDITALSNDVSVARRKVDHLVELLNESEANNMRLSEQVRLLKAEIRRLERNKEREEIVSNLEYLKNIMLKFITLQAGSERERLVPVLTTMLKLSSEEQNHIQQVASGQYLNAANNAGWSSYLQWSGLV